MTRAVLLAGGWAHRSEPTVDAVSRLCAERGWTTTVVTEPTSVASGVANGCDLLIVSACWFSMADDRYTDEQRHEHAVPRDADREAALDALRQRGCPLLALHTAVICFDGWDQWRSWLGGAWNWATSGHPPPQSLTVTPAGPANFDAFTVTDELYGGLDIDSGVTVLGRGPNHLPLVWTNQTERGRSAVSLLGHDSRSLDDEGHRVLLRELLDWLTELDEDRSDG